MRGSALNWSKSNYLKLVQELSTDSIIVITGTRSDADWVDPLKRAFSDNTRVRFLYDLLSLKELLYILKQSRCVIVPSTGVAHLASSVGAKVIGLYPDRTSQSPIRWRPLGANVHLLLSDQPELSGITVAQVKTLCLS